MTILYACNICGEIGNEEICERLDLWRKPIHKPNVCQKIHVAHNHRTDLQDEVKWDDYTHRPAKPGKVKHAQLIITWEKDTD